MNNIWLNPEHQDGGLSAVDVFQNEHVTVSLGGPNRMGFTHRLILFSLRNVDFTIIASDDDTITKWREIEDEGKMSEFAFKFILSHLTPEWFEYIMNDSFTRGVRAGRNEIRYKLSQLLDME